MNFEQAEYQIDTGITVCCDYCIDFENPSCNHYFVDVVNGILLIPSCVGYLGRQGRRSVRCEPSNILLVKHQCSIKQMGVVVGAGLNPLPRGLDSQTRVTDYWFIVTDYRLRMTLSLVT